MYNIYKYIYTYSNSGIICALFSTIICFPPVVKLINRGRVSVPLKWKTKMEKQDNWCSANFHHSDVTDRLPAIKHIIILYVWWREYEGRSIMCMCVCVCGGGGRCRGEKGQITWTHYLVNWWTIMADLKSRHFLYTLIANASKRRGFYSLFIGYCLRLNRGRQIKNCAWMTLM